MPLDWFLPALRKPDPSRPAAGSPWMFRTLRRCTPSGWGSDLGQRQPGRARRLLKRLGTTWLASPLRRLVQAACLILFVVLFVYVCWPYSAKPAQRWSGWAPVEVAADTGAVTLVADQPARPPLAAGSIVYVVDVSAGLDLDLGSFRVEHAEDQELRLTPARPLDTGQLDQMAESFGPWTLCEAQPGSWPSHYAQELKAKEAVSAELFLILDPLVSLSTAIAGRHWVWSLTAAAVILTACIFVPRGFCGYLCPLGTLIDLFDWSIGRRVTHFRVAGDGWWVHIKYYLLVGTLIAALLGVLVSGFVAAIPVVTRFLAFAVTTTQTGLLRSWHQVPPLGAGQWLSLGLFAVVLMLGLLRSRFWCKYVCPSGAVFSLGNLFRLTERKVDAACIHCNKCVKICPFDAIKPDFTTRTSDCTFCQTCGGVCPTQSITFVGRWSRQDWKATGDPPTGETPIGRRGFLASAAGLAAGSATGAALAASTRALGAGRDQSEAAPVVRPPGSVPEPQFLQLCIRCGECFQACPNDVLQPLGWQRGWEALWTPQVVADWSGCESSCANCGQVCPTGAIRALPLDEKRCARMGLAVVDQSTCLPYAGRDACQLCVDECVAAGYDAIEFLRVGTEVDPFGQPIEGSGFLAPVVVEHLCVGCGLCQTRCNGINHKQKKLLERSAIVIQAGAGKEDRLLYGSYRELRAAEQRSRDLEQKRREESGGPQAGYLPEFLQ